MFHGMEWNGTVFIRRWQGGLWKVTRNLALGWHIWSMAKTKLGRILIEQLVKIVIHSVRFASNTLMAYERCLFRLYSLGVKQAALDLCHRVKWDE
jgi:hypothetical protein